MFDPPPEYFATVDAEKEQIQLNQSNSNALLNVLKWTENNNENNAEQIVDNEKIQAVFERYQQIVACRERSESQALSGSYDETTATLTRSTDYTSTSSAGSSHEGDSNRESYNAKMVVIGNTGVGKSSFVQEYKTESLKDQPEPHPVLGKHRHHHRHHSKKRSSPASTIGVAIHTVLVDVDNDTDVTFSVWDTAGQERYRALSPMYYRHAEVALLVYDVNDQSSFEAIPDWLANLQQHIGSTNQLKCLMLIGHKADDDRAERQITFEQGAQLARSIGAQFMETSIYDVSRVRDVWQIAAMHVALRWRMCEFAVEQQKNSRSPSFALRLHEHQQRQLKAAADLCCMQ